MKFITSHLFVSCVCFFASCGSVYAEEVQPVSPEQAEAAAIGILTEVTALDRLRRGDTEGAIELLEVSLDKNIVILGGGDEVRRNTHIKKVLERAAEYRVNHPRKPDPILDAHVTELLKSYQKEKR